MEISEIFWNADLQMIRNGHPKFYRVLSICFFTFPQPHFFQAMEVAEQGPDESQMVPKQNWEMGCDFDRFWSILIDFDRFQWWFDVVWCCLWLGMLGIMRHPVTCSLVIRRWLQIQGVLQGSSGYIGFGQYPVTVPKFPSYEPLTTDGPLLSCTWGWTTWGYSMVPISAELRCS